MNSNPHAPGFPANPPQKEGWQLVFQEEFEGTAFDESKFLPYGLAHWYGPGENEAAYELRDSCLVLQLPDAQKGFQPWPPACGTGFTVSGTNWSCAGT
ncbi:hypothetical protein VQ056_20380 [Paenibacillus sp. JTLBN-2024]